MRFAEFHKNTAEVLFISIIKSRKIKLSKTEQKDIWYSSFELPLPKEVGTSSFLNLFDEWLR